jgi:hypothetical protein
MGNPEKSKRVTDPMLKIHKISVADLEQAYDGHRLLHNLQNLLAEITGRYLNISLVTHANMRATLCNSDNFLLACLE